MTTNNVEDIKKRSMHQPLLPLVVVVRASVSVVKKLPAHYVSDTVTSPYYLINIVPLNKQHRHNFIFIEHNASAHLGHIIRKQLLKVAVT